MEDPSDRPRHPDSGTARAPARPEAADTPTSDRGRPRERLRDLGAAALSLRELLSLLVGAGGPSGSSFDVADSILSHTGGRVRPLASTSPADLERVPGVGRATAARILAAVELGVRASHEERPERPRIHGPSDVFDLMAPRLKDLPHEEFHVLLLDTQHRVIRDVAITRGILDASLIHPREVFRPAILERAAAVILVHNHPSGDPSPSSEDRAVTRQITEAGRAIGIRVLDHVIVADRSWETAV